MNSFKILLSASVLALASTVAMAQTGSQILNNQINLDNNWSNLHTSVGQIGGDVVVQGAAGGNLIDITTMNDTTVLNNQNVGPNASVGSNITLGANHVGGSIGVQNQVICNGASVSTDPVLTAVQSNQECNATDPFSQINANVTDVGGNVVIQGSAIANRFEADSNAPNMPIVTNQINTSGSVSNITAGVFNTGGSVGVSSTAVGNTEQIIHYNTH
jgi:hypothetical protein